MNPRKSQERKTDLSRKSSLRRKDSTSSVPSLEFAYNPGHAAVDSYLLNVEMNSVGTHRQTAASYRHIEDAFEGDDSQAPEHKAAGKCRSNRKSNLSLASFGSGYFTTGRFYEHKKKNNSSLGTFSKQTFLVTTLSFKSACFSRILMLFWFERSLLFDVRPGDQANTAPKPSDWHWHRQGFIRQVKITFVDWF